MSAVQLLGRGVYSFSSSTPSPSSQFGGADLAYLCRTVAISALRMHDWQQILGTRLESNSKFHAPKSGVFNHNRGREGSGFRQGFVRYGDISSPVNEYEGNLSRNSPPKVTASKRIEAKIMCSKQRSKREQPTNSLL